MKKKFLRNEINGAVDFYLYGDIDRKFWGDECSADDLRQELEASNARTVNVLINSGGGNVFEASAMVSMLKRYKDQMGATIRAYVDGICASAATFIAMAADELHVYSNSIMMIHKPAIYTYGNASDLARDIETLNAVENDVMLPLYMARTDKTPGEILEMLEAETWFTGNPDSDDYIGNTFRVILEEEPKQVAACVSESFRNYKHVPEKVREELAAELAAEKEAEIEAKAEETTENETVEENTAETAENEAVTNAQNVEEPAAPDYSVFEDMLRKVRG